MEALSGTARRGIGATRANLPASPEGEEVVKLGGTALLIVDPQLDFHEDGSLAVPGANADAERIARLVTDHPDEIDEIFVTLDSHHVRFRLQGENLLVSFFQSSSFASCIRTACAL